MLNKSGFTLVEMIVGITISMLLMTSIGIFVAGGMENILKQTDIINKNTALTQTVSRFYEGFNSIQSGSGHVFSNNSGAIFRIHQNIQDGGFGYIGIISHSGSYCTDDSDIGNQNFLTWKTFIPHEEIGEDININFSDILTKTSGDFEVDTLNHQVKENGTVIVGGDIFGHEIEHGESGINTRLNSPTGFVEAEGGFFLSDTLNNRVLYYFDGNIYLLLDQYDGLSEPTGLAYDNVRNTLYIANSGKGEILSVSSEILSNNPDLSIQFSPEININNINRISLEFPQTIDSQTGSNFTFGNFTQDEDYLESNGNTIDYYFSNYNNNVSSQNNINLPGCTPSTVYSLNGTTPEKTVTTCMDTNTGSINEYRGDIFQDFVTGNDYQITLENITPVFSEGNKTIDVSFYNGANLEYSDTYNYFQQGDGFVNNMEFIKLETVVSGLGYPTGLEISGGDLLVNDFISREQYRYDRTNYLSTPNTSLSPFNSTSLENYNYNKERDILLENPLSNLTINYTNNFLAAKVEYYQYFNCYNPDEYSVKTFLLQKNID